MLFLTALSLALASANFAAATSKAPTPPLAAYVKNDLKTRDRSTYKIHSLTRHTKAPGGVPKRLTGLLEKCTTPSCFSLTFDDGPYIDHRFVADTVKNAGYKATFFVNGNNYQCIYDEANVERLRYSLAQGHTICTHTWGHADLNTLTFEQIDRQIELNEEALYKTIGIVPSCIRPPYGSANETVVKYLNEKWGLVIVNWTADSGDSATPMASTESQLDMYRGFKAPQQVVILQHEVYNRTAREVTPEAVKLIKAAGFKRRNVQGIGADFGFFPYKVVALPGKRDASWTCEGKPLPGQGDPPAPVATTSTSTAPAAAPTTA